MGRRERIDDHVAGILGFDARTLRDREAAPQVFWRSAATASALLLGLAVPGPEGSSRRHAEDAYTLLMTADPGRRPPSASLQPSDEVGSPAADKAAGAAAELGDRAAEPAPTARSPVREGSPVVRKRDTARRLERRLGRGAPSGYARLERLRPPLTSSAGARGSDGASTPPLSVAAASTFAYSADIRRRAEQRARLDAVDAIRFLRQK